MSMQGRPENNDEVRIGNTCVDSIARAIRAYQDQRESHERERVRREHKTIIVLGFTAVLALLAAPAAIYSDWIFQEQLKVEGNAKPGPQFYPVSAIDYLTGHLMAFGAMVALARRAKEGGSWLVRISLAQTGRWLVDRGEVPVAALKDVPKEIPQADIERWSIDSDAPAGKLRHLGPTVRLWETKPYWARPSVPLGHNQPLWPARAAV
jgi:hypothetical protein